MDDDEGGKGFAEGLVGVVGVRGPEAKAALSVAAKAGVMHAAEELLEAEDVLLLVLNKGPGDGSEQPESAAGLAGALLDPPLSTESEL